MEMKKMKQERRNHIPDDLFLMIFAKISEANSLCRFSLLSKRFASLIARTPTGTGTFTVKVNWVNPFCNMIPPLSREPSLPFNFFTNPIQSLFRPDNSVNEQLFISLGRFLKQFDRIESLHFQLLLSGYNPDIDPVVKWRIKFNFQRPKHFLIFSAKSITDYNQEEEESDEDENDNVKGELSVAEKIWLREFARYHMINAYARYLGLGIMVRKGVNVANAKITDSEDYGEIFVSEDEIVKLKNPMREKIDWVMHWALYYMPKLRLPGSGVVLKEVKIGWMRAMFEDKEDDDLDQVLDRGPEEETVMGEVFRELYLTDDTYFPFAHYTVWEDIH